jgi:mannose-6-phosphate isomerase-like protein (cupin superfamily)
MPGRTIDAGPGRTPFVPAGEDHRFHDVTEDLAVLVFFAPAYTGHP